MGIVPRAYTTAQHPKKSVKSKRRSAEPAGASDSKKKGKAKKIKLVDVDDEEEEEEEQAEGEEGSEEEAEEAAASEGDPEAEEVGYAKKKRRVTRDAIEKESNEQVARYQARYVYVLF